MLKREKDYYIKICISFCSATHGLTPPSATPFLFSPQGNSFVIHCIDWQLYVKCVLATLTTCSLLAEAHVGGCPRRYIGQFSRSLECRLAEFCFTLSVLLTSSTDLTVHWLHVWLLYRYFLVGQNPWQHCCGQNHLLWHGHSVVATLNCSMLCLHQYSSCSHSLVGNLSLKITEP